MSLHLIMMTDYLEICKSQDFLGHFASWLKTWASTWVMYDMQCKLCNIFHPCIKCPNSNFVCIGKQMGFCPQFWYLKTRLCCKKSIIRVQRERKKEEKEEKVKEERRKEAQVGKRTGEKEDGKRGRDKEKRREESRERKRRVGRNEQCMFNL